MSTFFEAFNGGIIERSGRIVMPAFNHLSHLFDNRFFAFA